MNSTPMITVLLPVYNGEKFLKEAIDSILNQTYSDFELIILDDCSTDHTADIIKAYSDKRIRYIFNEKNLKISASLNKGISLAKGKYIARMDADDISHPERFQKQIEFFENNPNIDIVNIRFNTMSEDGTHIRKFKYNISPSSESLKYLVHIDSFICHAGVMIRKEWYQNYNYNTSEDTYNVEDCDLWIRMFSNGANCHTIKMPLYNIRTNSTSVTHTNTGEVKQIENVCNLFQKSLKSNFNIEINKNTLRLVKGYITNESIMYINEFIKDLTFFESEIKKIEKSSSICKEIHHWAEYCKFRTCISIIKSKRKLNNKFKAVLSLIYNLRFSLFIIIKEYRHLYKI